MYYCLTFKTNPRIIYACIAVTHLFCIAPYVLTLHFLSACSSGKSRMKAILPTQGQNTASPAVSWARSNCEMQQLMSLMENSCIKEFCAADCAVSTGSTEEEQRCHQRGRHWALNRSFNVSQLQELQHECSGKPDSLLSSDSLSIICPFILLRNFQRSALWASVIKTHFMPEEHNFFGKSV